MLFKTVAVSAALSLSISAAAATPPEQRSEYWKQRVSLFDELPAGKGDIIFLGNSITDGCEPAELLGNPAVKNRGINSDDIEGVESRLGNIVDGSPAKIFLLIGINDVSHGLSPEELARRYESLVKKIVTATPSTMLYLQSVMPVNNDFARYKNIIGKENVITVFNDSIQSIADRYGAVYVDLFPALALPGTRKLNPEFTNDGLHLTGKGYKAWMRLIKPLIK